MPFQSSSIFIHEFSFQQCQWIEIISCWSFCDLILLLLSNIMKLILWSKKVSWTPLKIFFIIVKPHLMKAYRMYIAHTPFNDRDFLLWHKKSALKLSGERGLNFCNFILNKNKTYITKSISWTIGVSWCNWWCGQPFRCSAAIIRCSRIICYRYWILKIKEIQKKNHELTATDNGFPKWRKKIRFDPLNWNGYSESKKWIHIWN